MAFHSARARFLAGAGLLCAPALLHAQAATPATSDNPSIQSGPAPQSGPVTTAGNGPTASPPQGAPAAPGTSSGGFQEIIVTAQKRSENLQNVPIAVTALGTNQLASANIQGQIDLPKLTPNLSFTVNSGFASAYIRGVGTQFGNPGLEPSVSVYLDDIYLPRAGSALFDFADINRIEVLKGPQGTLYGRNATGGAIRIITNDPSDHFEAKAQATFGSYSTRNFSGMVNEPLGDGIALRVTAQHEGDDGYMRNLNPGGDADGNKRGMNRNQELYTAKLLIDKGPLKIKLTGDYSRKDDRDSVSAANLYAGAPQQVGAALGGAVSNGFYTYANDGQDSLHTKAYGGELRIDYDLGPATVSSISGYRVEQEHNCEDIDGTGAFVEPVCGTPKTKQFTQELQIASNGHGPLRYVSGLYFLHETSGYAFFVRTPSIGDLFAPPGTVLTATSPQVGLVSDPNNNIRVKSIAPYAQVDWDFTRTLSLSLGGRYTYEQKDLTHNDAFLGMIGADGFPESLTPVLPSPTCTATSPAPCNDLGKTTNFSEFTYKATLSWKPIEKVLLYATVSKGFKSGGLNLPAFTSVSVVKPEKLQDYEIGWKAEHGPFRWNGAAYYYDYKDLQIAITDQLTGGTDIKNAASAHIKGVESDLAIIPARGVELGVGGSYTDAKYKDFTGQAYYPCGEVAGLSAPTAAAAAGVVAAEGACAAQGNLGEALVDGRNLSGKRLINTPKYAGYVRAQYTYDADRIGKFTLSGIANYRSKAYFDSANLFVDKSRVLVSAKLSWTAPNERFFASVYGENLTGKQYNEIESPEGTGGWRIAAPPREIFGSFGVKF